MSNSKKKKTVSTVVATTLTAAVLLAGTYAWQNLNQEALNVAADVANPGGRLHDDFNGKNKDVYVENFSDLPIYARIQLTEYMEKGENAGINLEDTAENRGVSLITEGADYSNKSTWPIHYYEGGNETDTYWTWSFGGETIYMPTFNLNQDSLEPEINGTYEGTEDGDDIHYDDYVKYDEGATLDEYEVSDFDDNTDDEGAEAVEGSNIITSTELITHTAKATDTATVISMEEWNNLSEEEKETAYWVYDTDGWAYYSKPIEAKTATGLLLDEIELTEVVGDSWYYAINVIAQFVTANDVGKDDNTGFYDTSKGTAPTADAESLLVEIGVDIPGDKISIDVLNSSGTYYINQNYTFVGNINGKEVPEETWNYYVREITDDGIIETTNATISENGEFIANMTGKFKIVAYLEENPEVVAEKDIEVIELTDSDLQIIENIATNPVVGSTAAGGEGNNLYDYYQNIGTYPEYVTIDDMRFLVLAKEETEGKERALLYSLEQYVQYIDGEEEWLRYFTYNENTSWSQSDISKYLNTEENIELEIFSDKTYTIKNVTAPGFLATHPTISKLAQNTTITTRNYDESGKYTMDSCENKVFLLSEADFTGTTGGQQALPEEYTYRLNGQGVQLFDDGEIPTGTMAGGCYINCYSSWLRSQYSNNSFAFIDNYGIVPKDLSAENTPNRKVIYSFLGRFICS